MKLTRPQWETLDMVIENPSREGIDTIKFSKHSMNGYDEWFIQCWRDDVHDADDMNCFMIDETGERVRANDE